MSAVTALETCDPQCLGDLDPARSNAERAGIAKIGWDSRFQLVKISPLADWSIERVGAYVRERGLPYNPLHDRQYPSIGCTHCTRAVHPGEDPRAGRWPESTKRECGLHAWNGAGDCLPALTGR